MAYEDHEQLEPRTTEEALEAARRSLEEIEEKIEKLSEDVDDAAAGIRLEIMQNRREMVEVRSALGRLQSRFDNQLMVLVLGNIASGIGVAALVLGASHAFG